MKRMSRWVLIVLLLGLIPLLFFAPGAIRVAVGYSAKQLCSGVFVARLPEEFVTRYDIHPRMAVLGPALSQLQLTVDAAMGAASASLFGIESRAIHQANQGCVLHGTASGSAPLSTPPIPEVAQAATRELSDALNQAFDEPDGSGRNTLAVLVSSGGQLLAERYASPVTASNRLQGWSMNKSLMATWVGILAEQGGLDPSLPLRELLPEETEFSSLNPQLTLLHLLQMESGLGFREFYGPGADVTRMLYLEPAMWKVPATSGSDEAPGEFFSYSSGDLVLASYVWQRALPDAFNQWIEREFSEPLGISSLVAEADASGIQVGSSYTYMTARDWLRVGEFWLDAWHGRSAVLSQQWMRDSVTPRPSGEHGRYGRGFWLNTGGVAFPGLPADTFYASGNAGQFLIVIPEWDTVVLRLGLTQLGRSTGVQELLQAIQSLRGGSMPNSDP